MFWAAGQLFGWKFQPAANVPVYHADVRVWEVQTAEGRHIGLFYFDPYARAGKKSGAWMDGYRSQQRVRQRDYSAGLEQLEFPESHSRPAGVDFVDRRGNVVSRIRPCRARALLPTSPIRHCPAPACRATTSNCPRSCSNTGCPLPSCWTAIARHYQTGEADAGGTGAAHSKRPPRSTRVSPPRNSWPARCWT